MQSISGGWVSKTAEIIHHYMLALVVGSYVLAAIWPQLGLLLRTADVGWFLPNGAPRLSIPALLLAFLLFNAGLGMQTRQLLGLMRRPWLLLVGVLANLILPVFFIVGVATTLQLWHNPREVQEILVGLALIASMPIAGSSTAWVQNADGDLALSIGLVVVSTTLSPITTPLVLRWVGWMAAGEYAEALHELATGGVGSFLATFVVLPSLLGIAGRMLIGERQFGRLRPLLKLCSSIVLLVLCYSNAAVALPQTVHRPDWDFLAVMLVIVLAMCSLGFVAGSVLGSALRAEPAQRISLMFSLGMTNNGTGLVVAAQRLAHFPAVLLPIIFYNLVQHIVAAVTDRFWIGSNNRVG